MDMNVLMSAQLLMEQVAAEGGGPLLYLLYQHVLFHFHLWSPSDFAVRLGGCGDLNGGMPAGTGGGRGSEKLEPRFGPSEGTARPWGMWQGHGPVLEGQQKGPSSGRGGGGLSPPMTPIQATSSTCPASSGSTDRSYGRSTGSSSSWTRCAPITGEAGGGGQAVGLTQQPLVLGMGFGPPSSPACSLPSVPLRSPGPWRLRLLVPAQPAAGAPPSGRRRAHSADFAPGPGAGVSGSELSGRGHAGGA